MAEFLLGIDTGGTFTDGVLLDKASRSVVATTKTPTTHHDLKEGILNALQALLPEHPGAIRLVAISTTLATNAIAEGKGRPVALLLLGYDPELVGRFNFSARFGTPQFHYLQGGHDLHGKPQAPLAETELVELVKDLGPEIEALAVSGYFSPFNAAHELRAYELIRQNSELPVVLGHQLSTRLNSIQRATTATLNASLLSVLNEFVQAIRHAMRQRRLEAPLMVVRGDGALMAQELARDKPVETVHSGPAASAIGGRFLAAVDEAVVIDVGGTTTDIALVRGGRVQVKEGGTTVGDYSTAVRAADIHSIGLGGDSQIQFDVEDQLVIGPNRVRPITRLAHEHPRVAAEIEHRRSPDPSGLEYWFLSRKTNASDIDARAHQVLELLSDGPKSLPYLLDRMGLIHPIQFQANRLLQTGVIERSGLTPTDLFHVSGEYSPWDPVVAEKAAWAVSRPQGLEPIELARRVREQMARTIVAQVISFISGHTLQARLRPGSQPDLGAWLFQEHLTPDNPFLGSTLFLKTPLVGIGAPAKLVLPRVAEILGTELLIPDHFEVANAIGAVAGSVTVTQEAWIYPQMRGRHVGGYYVQAASSRSRFPRLEQARQFAKEQCRQQALAQAQQSGVEQAQVDYVWIEDGAESHRLLVQVSGAPSLG